MPLFDHDASNLFISIARKMCSVLDLNFDDLNKEYANDPNVAIKILNVFAETKRKNKEKFNYFLDNSEKFLTDEEYKFMETYKILLGISTNNLNDSNKLLN